MRPQGIGRQEAVGIWEPATARIIIKRDQLKNIQSYAATLLHETAHARSGATDITEDFEAELTKLLGKLAENGLWSDGTHANPSNHAASISSSW